ncbi:MAG TPA: CvpA family protein [Candidatus Tumulicola sp.]
MIAGIAWPDAAIGLLLIVGTLKGYSRGFVAELGGIAAVAAGLIAPWYYNGAADGQIEAVTKLGAGPAHVAGMIGTGIAAYVIILVASAFLGRVAKLPLLGIGNALAGAIAGFVKAAILVWFVLFVTSLFAMPAPIAASLRESRLVPYFTQFDAAIDAGVARVVPSFARPVLDPMLDRGNR